MGHFHWGGFGIFGFDILLSSFWSSFTPKDMQRYHQKKHVWVGNLPVEPKPPRVV